MGWEAALNSTTALYLVEFCLAIFRGPVIPWYLWQLSNMAGQWSIWKSIWLRISAPGMPSPDSDLSPEPFLGRVARMRTIGQGQNLHHCSSVEERSKGWLDSNRDSFVSTVTFCRRLKLSEKIMADRGNYPGQGEGGGTRRQRRPRSEDRDGKGKGGISIWRMDHVINFESLQNSFLW